MLSKIPFRRILLIVFFIALTALLGLLPSPVGKAYSRGRPAKAEVIDVDNSDVRTFGLLKQGSQDITLKICSGKHKGKEVRSVNTLIGKLELDVFYQKGDVVFAVITEGQKGLNVSTVGYFRIDKIIWLFVFFSVFLVLFARFTGVKALFSFLITALCIWKILLPGFLSGLNPVILSAGVILFLSAVILFLVSGFNRRGLTAFLGTFTGILVTALLSLFFGNLFKISGAVKPFAETLLYSGYAHLDLTLIFISGIFLASSGAVMDIATDVAASMHEVLKNNPGISRKKLTKSGFSVGRHVVGTMTTTLLFAYSGGYIAMLLVFLGQGTPVLNILNIQYVAAEILHLLVGSFGLVAAAPLTSFIGGFLLKKSKS